MRLSHTLISQAGAARAETGKPAHTVVALRWTGGLTDKSCSLSTRFGGFYVPENRDSLPPLSGFFYARKAKEIVLTIKAQGTNLYAMDPDTGDVIDVGCVTSISGIDETVEQIETTCLSEDSRTYEAGLSTPGTASFTIQFDPENEVHVQMHEWKRIGKHLHWAVGFRQESAIAAGTDPSVPDSEEDPVDSGVFMFDLPADRSWIVFEGLMNSYPFDFQGNSVVTSNIGVQISGEIDVVPATE